jgi:hypothetical protein
MEQLKMGERLISESQGQHLGLTVLYVPYSLDIGSRREKAWQPAALNPEPSS